MPSELIAAFLWAQMEEADDDHTPSTGDLGHATTNGSAIWRNAAALRRPVLPPHCTHNAHMYYVLLPTLQKRTAFIAGLKEAEIQAVFHYVPLHDAPMGVQFGRAYGELGHTLDASNRLVRLPLWLGIEPHLADGNPARH